MATISCILFTIFLCRLSIQMCTEDHGEELTAETLLHRLSVIVTVVQVRGREGVHVLMVRWKEEVKVSLYERWESCLVREECSYEWIHTL